MINIIPNPFPKKLQLTDNQYQLLEEWKYSSTFMIGNNPITKKDWISFGDLRIIRLTMDRKWYTKDSRSRLNQIRQQWLSFLKNN